MAGYKSIAIILAVLPILLGAQSPSTIERSQEILQEDKALRQKIEQEEKFLVKTIVLTKNFSSCSIFCLKALSS